MWWGARCSGHLLPEGVEAAAGTVALSVVGADPRHRRMTGKDSFGTYCAGRCAVCVEQRKGKCGTISAPKRCLRRQAIALRAGRRPVGRPRKHFPAPAVAPPPSRLTIPVPRSVVSRQEPGPLARRALLHLSRQPHPAALSPRKRPVGRPAVVPADDSPTVAPPRLIPRAGPPPAARPAGSRAADEKPGEAGAVRGPMRGAPPQLAHRPHPAAIAAAQRALARTAPQPPKIASAESRAAEMKPREDGRGGAADRGEHSEAQPKQRLAAQPPHLAAPRRHETFPVETALPQQQQQHQAIRDGHPRLPVRPGTVQLRPGTMQFRPALPAPCALPAMAATPSVASGRAPPPAAGTGGFAAHFKAMAAEVVAGKEKEKEPPAAPSQAAHVPQFLAQWRATAAAAARGPGDAAARPQAAPRPGLPPIRGLSGRTLGQWSRRCRSATASARWSPHCLRALRRPRDRPATLAVCGGSSTSPQNIRRIGGLGRSLPGSICQKPNSVFQRDLLLTISLGRRQRCADLNGPPS